MLRARRRMMNGARRPEKGSPRRAPPGGAMMRSPECAAHPAKGEMKMRVPLSVAVALLALALPLAAQESPFVPPKIFEALNGEISGDISYDHLRHLTLHHSPSGASRGFRDKMRWIAGRAREFGLEDVRIIDDLRFRGPGWSPVRAELWMTAPGRRRIISYDEVAIAIADHSRTGTWEGELIDVGAGTRDEDYKDLDVKGKIVLASGGAAAVMEQAVWKRGALGVVSYNPSRGLDYPDQVPWTRLSGTPPEGKQNTFAFSITYRMASELKQRLARQQAARGEPAPAKIVLRAEVESEFEENPKQWIVEGWIRGANPALAEQAVLLTAHGQEEKTSANDDNSGCANLLEIGRALVKMIREGRLERPARPIRFWWVNEFAAEYEYFSVYPDERKKLLLGLNQDMVGAKQSAGSRIQHATRLPHSRPHVLGVVFEDVVGMVMRGNSGYLAAGQAGSAAPFSRPILSVLGTRERYGAEIVPYFGNTDHHAFNDSIIGVPAVTLTNWPDDFIHSSDDDVWQMDATQLKRNAFIVAATAWYFATLAPESTAALAAKTAVSAQQMMMEAFARATEMLTQAAADDRAAAFHDGLNLIDQTALRAAATLGTIGVFAPPDAVKAQVDAAQKAAADAAVRWRAALVETYRLLTGQAAPASELTSEEREMARKIPEVAASVGDYLEKRRGIRGTGLHGLMQFETWNFVDGRRSYLDIYRAVRAEAQLAGEWYYGRVTAKQVADLLDAGVKAGMLRLKSERAAP
jgi:hypothetical protein